MLNRCTPLAPLTRYTLFSDTPAPSEYNVRVDARGAPTLRHGKKSLGKNPAFSSTAPRTQSLGVLLFFF